MAETGGTDPAVVRVGTAEREQAVSVLGEHFAAGRLRVDEYEQRVGETTAATTQLDLSALFRDLPLPHPSFMTAPVPATGHEAVVPEGRSRVVAGILNIVLPFGTGRFYAGNTSIAMGQLVLAFCGFGVLWSIADGVAMLLGGGTDGDRKRLR